MKEPPRKDSIQASLAQLYGQLDNKRQPEPLPPPRVVMKPRKGGLKSGMKKKKGSVKFQTTEDAQPKVKKKVAFGEEPEVEVKRVVFGVEEPPAEVLFGRVKTNIEKKRDIFDHGEAPKSVAKARVASQIASHWDQLQEEARQGPRKPQGVVVHDGSRFSKGDVYEMETIELRNTSTVSLVKDPGGSEIEEIEYPTAIKLFIIVFAVSLAVFCTGLVIYFLFTACSGY